MLETADTREGEEGSRSRRLLRIMMEFGRTKDVDFSQAWRFSGESDIFVVGTRGGFQKFREPRRMQSFTYM